ncbi:MAG: dihydropteroate synthase [Sedimentitalea sp.]
MTIYFRPLVQHGPVAPGAVPLAGGPLWFSHVEQLTRTAPPQVLPASMVPAQNLARLSQPRKPIAGLDLGAPRIMGIVNVTPDSFSDGGQTGDVASALAAARAMVAAGVDLIDVGGESTRPGADLIPVDVEIARTAPVIAALGELGVPLSIDTRKAEVAKAAIKAGADLVNDVSGFGYDPELAPLCAAHQIPVCTMHAQGDPATMQNNPRYNHVLLDVYDTIAAQVDHLVTTGIARDQIMVDPGIGFGKTVAHNLELLQNIALFHGLGCAILLGVSRKGFIGKLGNVPDPQMRGPGSVAVGLAALAQGVQVLRVHDVTETAQALCLWQAVRTGSGT